MTAVRIEPACAVCGSVTGTIVLSRTNDAWHLATRSYGGAADSSIVSDERAALITAASSLPYDGDKLLWSAGLDEIAGFCRQCHSFYCGAHWRNNAWCPRGHLMSVEPWSS